jgi:ferredoxin-thioredoxin reductase catalytic chain
VASSIRDPFLPARPELQEQQLSALGLSDRSSPVSVSFEEVADCKGRPTACKLPVSAATGYEQGQQMTEPKEASLEKMWKYVRSFAEKSGTTMHPNAAVTESVVKGLAMHVDELGKPLCPCNFYKDKAAEAKLRRWICACDEMQIYKYCHCLLFVREDGMPITEYLPEGHEGREVYGIVTDPTPEKGRALRHKAVAQPRPTDK